MILKPMGTLNDFKESWKAGPQRKEGESTLWLMEAEGSAAPLSGNEPESHTTACQS
jgi:hypothetical protein